VKGELSAGEILGGYELLEPVAKGGTALIWAARSIEGDGALVAIKTLPGADEQLRLMSRDEAALTNAIRHENVAAVLGTGEHAGTPYMVMEWIDGEPLDVIVQHAARRGGLPFAVAIELVRQAALGLHAAHELRGPDGELRKLVHRDISPQNVMVTYDGMVKLVDFGIAKATNRSAHTQLGQIKGKLAYMAPEQVRAAAVDRRADVFAMGVVLYLITTGRQPFKASTPAETVRRICFAGAPTSPTTINPAYPAALEPVVMKALAKDPAERYATALELSNDLANVAESLGARRDIGNFLQKMLADRIHERRAFLDQALATADARRDRRNAPTVPPPGIRASRPGPQVTGLPRLDYENDETATFSSLQALIVTDAAPSVASDAGSVLPKPFSRVRRRALPLIALASALAAVAVFSPLVAYRAATSARGVQSSLAAPQRLAAETLLKLGRKLHAR